MNRFKLLGMVAVLYMLAACGGGISGTGVMPSGNDIVLGTIEGFGSVIVNQRRLTTDRAEIVVNGRRVSQRELSVGMQVRVNADLRSQSASRVEYVPLVVGPVTGIDTLTGVIEILGHTIIPGNSTVYEGLAVGQVSRESVLEVSGFINADAQIIATFIRSVPESSPFQVLATISASDFGFDISTELSNLDFGLDDLGLDLEQLLDFDDFDPFSFRRAVVGFSGDSEVSDPVINYLLPASVFVDGAAVDLLQVVTGNVGADTLTTDAFVVTTGPNTSIVFDTGALGQVSDARPGRIIRVTGRQVGGGATVLAERIEIVSFD